MLGQGGGTLPCGSLCLCLRLLHSLTNLKRVIINAAHYLVLGDKDTYRHDPAAPFLSTVSSTLPHGSPHPSTLPQGAQPYLSARRWVGAQRKGPSLRLCPGARLAGAVGTARL